MRNRRKLCAALGLLAAFILWTGMVTRIDVRPIGPQGSVVGFSALNGLIHELTGVHWTLYRVTDWLGLVPLCFVLGFAGLGLVQWIRRKRLWSVDRSILTLGGFYLIVLVAYGFFERYIINYRPVLIDGVLEASYPSSTTLLVLTVMPTAAMQLNARIRNSAGRRAAGAAIAGFVMVMVVGRLASGVHWISDIIGGALFSAGLVLLYASVCGLEETKGKRD